MSDAYAVFTLADVNVKLVRSDGISKSVDRTTFQSLVGSLLYAAVCNRPDISNAVSIVSKFFGNLDGFHFTAEKIISKVLLCSRNCLEE